MNVNKLYMSKQRHVMPAHKEKNIKCKMQNRKIAERMEVKVNAE